MNNFWIKLHFRKIVLKRINSILCRSFLGKDYLPVNQALEDIENSVLDYFRKNPDDIVHILNEKSIVEYQINIEEKHGKIIFVEIK